MLFLDRNITIFRHVRENENSHTVVHISVQEENFLMSFSHLPPKLKQEEERAGHLINIIWKQPKSLIFIKADCVQYQRR